MSMPWQPDWTPNPSAAPSADPDTPPPDLQPAVLPMTPPAGVLPAAADTPPAPSLREEIGGIVQDMVTEALKGAGIPQTAPAVDILDLTKASARSRALRTLGIGLGISVLWAVVNIISQLAGVPWDTDAWGQVATLVIGTILSAVSSYVLRIIKPPVYAADAPSKAP